MIVCLTPAGRTLADRAIKYHFESLAQMLSGLSATERNDLAQLLAKLLMVMERPVATDMPARGKKRARANSRNIVAQRAIGSSPILQKRRPNEEKSS